MNQDCSLNSDIKLGQADDEIKQNKSEYVKISRDIYFEEAGQLKCLKSGKMGKRLSCKEFKELLESMSEDKKKEFFVEFDRDENRSIVLIDSCIHFLNYEDYSCLKLASKPFVLRDQVNLEDVMPATKEETQKKRPAPPKGHKPYNTNGEGGRPVKYTDEFLEKEAEEFEKWMKLPESIYFKRFAFDRGYSPQRLSEFAEQNRRFSEVYKRAKEWQEIRLAEGGLTSEFNSGFCKFVMGNVCGWTDRTETKISGDAANPLSFILDSVNGNTKELVKDNE